MRRQTMAWVRGRLLPPVTLAAVGLALWFFASSQPAVPNALLPSPTEVFSRLVSDWRDQFAAQTGVTITEASLGCLLATVIALPLGYVIARSKPVAAATAPFLAASQAIPAVALAPLLVLWMGYGLEPITVLCSILVFFPMVLSVTLGLRMLDREVLEAAQIDGAGGWWMVRHIELPLALPAILTGLRNGFTLSVTGAVVGELVMGGSGLGMVLSVQAATGDTVGLFATIIVLVTIAVGIYVTLLILERLADPLAPRRELSVRRSSHADLSREAEVYLVTQDPDSDSGVLGDRMAPEAFVPGKTRQSQSDISAPHAQIPDGRFPEGRVRDRQGHHDITKHPTVSGSGVGTSSSLSSKQTPAEGTSPGRTSPQPLLTRRSPSFPTPGTW